MSENSSCPRAILASDPYLPANTTHESPSVDQSQPPIPLERQLRVKPAGRPSGLQSATVFGLEDLPPLTQRGRHQCSSRRRQDHVASRRGWQRLDSRRLVLSLKRRFGLERRWGHSL